MLRKFWRESESRRILFGRFLSGPNPQTERFGPIFGDLEPAAILWRERRVLVHPRKPFRQERFVQQFPAAEKGLFRNENISGHFPAGVPGFLLEHQPHRFPFQPFAPPPPTFQN
jgi:hypothetical protein